MQLSSNLLRSLFFQAIFVCCIIVAGLYLFNNLQAHLSLQRISTGFDFLDYRAGFSISPHFIEFNYASSYGDAFLVGLINTLIVSSISIVLATILGITLGVMRLSRNWLFAKISLVYVEVIRNIPLLLQIFFWYYAVLRSLPVLKDSISISDNIFINNRGIFFPQVLFDNNVYAWLFIMVCSVILLIVVVKFINKLLRHPTYRSLARACVTLVVAIYLYCLTVTLGDSFEFIYPTLGRFNFSGGWSLMPEFIAIVLALSLYTASYIAEIVRGGIASVDYGQTEAAHALGISAACTRKYIIVPQAMRAIVPAMTSQYLNLIKNSSLAAAIAFPELVAIFTGVVLNQTGQAIETVMLAMVVYLTISLIVSLLMNWYNHKAKLIQ